MSRGYRAISVPSFSSSLGLNPPNLKRSQSIKDSTLALLRHLGGFPSFLRQNFLTLQGCLMDLAGHGLCTCVCVIRRGLVQHG